jgi:hypothetical protein
MPPPATRKNQRREASIFDTLRSVILNRCPKLVELVRKRFPGDPGGAEAFAYALELFLRVIPNLDVSLDGWKMFRLASETATSLQAVGIMHVLPSGVLSVDVTLSTGLRGTQYRVRIGIGDSQWESLSDSNRWEAVYLYASGPGIETPAYGRQTSAAEQPRSQEDPSTTHSRFRSNCPGCIHTQIRQRT